MPGESLILSSSGIVNRFEIGFFILIHALRFNPPAILRLS